MTPMQLAVSNFLKITHPRPGVTMHCTECGKPLEPPRSNCRSPSGNRFCKDTNCCRIYHNKKRNVSKEGLIEHD